MTQSISATIIADHSQSDELRPIRIGAMAQQPAPDATIIYVGLALLLPVRLRAICCAGLFYAQIASEQQDGRFELVVAALPRYLADPDIYGSHLHICTISYRELDQLLGWDRCLAAMATCDLRDCVAEYAAQSRRSIHAYTQIHAVKEISAQDEISVTSDCAPPFAPLDASAGAQERPVKRLSAPLARAQTVSHQVRSSYYEALPSVDVDTVRFEMTTIEVPVRNLQEIFYERKGLTVGDHHYRPSQRGWNISLLMAGMQYLKQERLQTDNWEKKGELKAKERDLRQALSLRNRGVPLQMEITPIYARGKNGSMTGCQMTVDIPRIAA